MGTSLDRRALLAGAGAAAAAGHASAQPGIGPVGGAFRRGFGWMPDRPDRRDRLLGAPAFAPPALRPASVDLSAKFPPAYDQGQLGSCTANAIAAAVQYSRRVNNKPGDFVPSRLFIYYQERKMEDSIYTDNGARIRDGIASIVKYGVLPEDKWPYDGIAGDPVTHVFPSNAQAIKEPPADVMQAAQPYVAISYAPLQQDVAVLENCLASGFPFIFGFTVYDNFNEATKLLKTPGPSDQVTTYGHAVLAVGYNQARKTFKIRNSWGPKANDGGHFEMEYGYVLDPGLAANFWVVYETLKFIS